MIVTANVAPSELPALADADPFAYPTITGTTGTDNIQGTAGADVIDARHGGNDIICAGPGFHRIYGDAGNDTAVNSIDNVVGNDDVDGGTGFDH
jgi:Ca2+-binding RTX toxin-like protein